MGGIRLRRFYPTCANACRDSIIFTGLMGLNVRETRTSPATLSSV